MVIIYHGMPNESHKKIAERNIISGAVSYPSTTLEGDQKTSTSLFAVLIVQLETLSFISHKTSRAVLTAARRNSFNVHRQGLLHRLKTYDGVHSNPDWLKLTSCYRIPRAGPSTARPKPIFLGYVTLGATSQGFLKIYNLFRVAPSYLQEDSACASCSNEILEDSE